MTVMPAVKFALTCVIDNKTTMSEEGGAMKSANPHIRIVITGTPGTGKSSIAR